LIRMPPADTAILLLGAQRSGTTWLGKICDSHPDVLYRHEPDHGRVPRRAMDEALLRATVATWIDDRSQRAAGKRPFFRKSWQSAPAFWLRDGLAWVLAAGARVPLLGQRIAHLPLPDLARQQVSQRAALKSIDWCDGAGSFARLLPDSRTIVILRHPCGQVASIMRGNRQGQFSLREVGTDMPFDEAPTVRFAAERGIDNRMFQALPDAAKYAWDWVRFNEAALRGLQSLPNARIVVYEELCARPAEIARELLEFCGLDWHKQTEAFIANSTQHSGAAGYYAVFRDSIAAAERWRTSMAPEDRAAVLSVAKLSPLRQFWADLS
jgi:hypothetical protein